MKISPIIALLSFLLCIFCITACNKLGDDKEPPAVSFENGTGIFPAKAGKSITLTPTVENADDPSYEWTMDEEIVGRGAAYTFVPTETGRYYLKFTVTARNGSASIDARIDVSEVLVPSVQLPSDDGVIGAVAGTPMEIEPDVLYTDAASVWRWTLDGVTVSAEKTYTFLKTEPGDYRLVLEVTNEDGTGRAEAMVRAGDAPGITVVFDTGQKSVPRQRTLCISPYVYNTGEDTLFAWEVDGVVQAGETGCIFNFTPDIEKEYSIKVSVTSGGKSASAETTVICTAPYQPNPAGPSSSPYSTSVFEFMPAPGQFVNEGYTAATHDEACLYANAVLQNNYSAGRDDYVSLGGFGGYIIVGFDHSIENAPSGADLAVRGNSYPGSSEPGIVWVMQDENGNGLPDDTWYELRGSETGKETTISQYSVTYYKPLPNHRVRWTDSRGVTGYIERVSIHTQESYYPLWVTDGSYVLHGTCLGLRNEIDPGSGYWVNAEYDWGYADNYGTDTDGSSMETLLDIDNAIRPDGLPANLSHIDFVKVQTGVNGKSGPLGEISTEVLGFRDLNLNM